MIDQTWMPERVAHRSTRGEGIFAKKRWTELSVYFLANPPAGGRHWLVVTSGCTSVEGETTRTATVAANSLADALGYLHASAPARAMVAEAHDWFRANAARIANLQSQAAANG